MRRLIASFALVLSLVGVATPAMAAGREDKASASATALPKVDLGSRTITQTYPAVTGTDVKWVQTKIGKSKMGPATGVADTLFAMGVKWWQSEHGLYPSGMVARAEWESFGVTPTY